MKLKGIMFAFLIIGGLPEIAMSSGAMRSSVPLGSTTGLAGYRIDGTGATYVQGSWIVPSVAQCGWIPIKDASFWVGIDGGADTSKTLEQIGTDSDCGLFGHGWYYAWYEMYPQQVVAVNINDPVSPGDVMWAYVRYLVAPYGSFVLSITDATKGWTFHTVQHTDNPGTTGVQWITERDVRACWLSWCRQPLADFGTVYWGYSYTHAGGDSNFANISGQGAPLGWFVQNSNSAWSVTEIRMAIWHNVGGTVLLDHMIASTSDIVGDDSFTNTWYASS